MKLDIDNFINIGFGQCVEQYHIVNTVKEFRCKCFFQGILNNAFGIFVIGCSAFRIGVKTYTLTKILKLTSSNIGCHYNNGILEVDSASKTVSKLSFI